MTTVIRRHVQASVRGRRSLVLAAFLTPLTVFGAQTSEAPTSEPFRITLLGTGNPRPTIERFGPSVLVEAGRHKILIDAGRGATIRLSQLGISSGAIEAVLLTHLHSDHVVGLPDLWLSGWIFNRRTPLALVGPQGVRSMATYLTRAFAFDIHARRDLDEHLPADGIRLSPREIREGTAYRTTEGLVISSFLVDHGPVRPALGYRVEFDLRQRQDSTVFRMPLDIMLTTGGGPVGRVVWDTARVQHIRLEVPDSASAIAVDPSGWVVKASST